MNGVRISELGGPADGTDEPATEDAAAGAPVAGGSRSVDRALQVLTLVARAGRPIRFVQLQRETRIAKGTLHGLVQSLTSAGFLQATVEGLVVGLTAFEVGTSVPVVRSARANADDALDELLARTGESSHFGTLVEGDVLYLNRRDATFDLRSASRIGDRKRAYGTALGKAMLALEDDETIESLYPDDLPALTPNSVRTRSDLLEHLQTARERGFASEREESTLGVRCIGMAFRAAGQLFGLSLTVPVQRMGEEELELLQPVLAEAVHAIEASMRASAWLRMLEPR
ncbi:MAG: IclR family transcriptional regulator [Actinomycetota bacterium]|nr:IclR family transcriptional regulator [Actinomycetota bacterium]